MILKMFAVFDSKTGLYMNPFFALAVAQAMRNFGDLVTNSETSIHKHPEDYQLFLIGTFNQDSGKFDGETNPVYLSQGVDFVPSNNVTPIKEVNRETENSG